MHDTTITYKEYNKEILNRFISILTKKFIEDGFPKEVAEPQAEYTASRICEHEDITLKELYDSYISGSVSLYDIQKQDIDITSSGNNWNGATLEKTLDNIRQVIMENVETKVALTVEEMQFVSGQSFKDWIAMSKDEIANYIKDIVQ